MLGPASGPALTEPVLVSRDGAAADSSPLANSTKEGHLSPASCGAFTLWWTHPIYAQSVCDGHCCLPCPNQLEETT